jgi:hypothetical protein
VSVLVTTRRFACVRRVLMKSLMTRDGGSAPQRRGGAERSLVVSKSAVYIYLRSNLTAGVPGSTFFYYWHFIALHIIVSVLSVGRNRWHNHRWLIL